MAALLALASAMLFGVGDFMGGMAARRLRTLVVAAWAQLIGLAGVVSLIIVVLPASHPTFGDLAWGAAAGAVGAVGLLLLYQALATGPMSVAAPVTAIFSALVPVGAGLAFGERPGLLAAGGVALALPAIFLIAGGDDNPGPGPHGVSSMRALLPSLGAGLGFGLFFVLLQRTSHDAGLWPLVGARTVSTIGLFGLATFTSGPIRLVKGSHRLVVVCGVCDVGANALYLAAVTRGLLSLVAVLAALYPASTVVLARLVLKERMRARQLVGLGLAVVAATLVAVSG